MNLCTSDSTKCFDKEYRDFSYSQLETVLGMKDTSKADFITYWSKAVADEFKLEASDIEASYSDGQTDQDLRAMWKYAAGKGVHATPTAFVNGAYLDSVPFSVAGWLALLTEVHHS